MIYSVIKENEMVTRINFAVIENGGKYKLCNLRKRWGKRIVLMQRIMCVNVENKVCKYRKRCKWYFHNYKMITRTSNIFHRRRV